MYESTPPPVKPHWTWADQVSTYRFWGLYLFSFQSTIGLAILTSFLALFYQQELDIPMAQIGVFYTAMAAGGFLGLYLAWAAVRSNTKAYLVAMLVLEIVGCILAIVPALAQAPALRMLGGFLMGTATATTAIAVPAVIAGGQGGIEAFAIVFGSIATFTKIGQMQAPLYAAQFVESVGLSSLPILVISYFVVSLVFLLPVKASLFNQPPGPRGYALTPEGRDPLVTALLSLIPFYWLYWLYRAHGEVTALAPTRSILSPRASWLVSLFVPLLYPIIITSLIDALNAHAAAAGKAPYRKPWAVFLWAFFVLPVAIGLVQSSINQAGQEPAPLQAA